MDDDEFTVNNSLERERAVGLGMFLEPWRFGWSMVNDWYAVVVDAQIMRPTNNETDEQRIGKIAATHSILY